MRAEPEPRRFYFVGERLCVDFVNTEIVQGENRIDLLRSFDDLLDWCIAAGVIGSVNARALARRWSEDAADAALRHAVRLRATLREMLERLAKGPTHVPQQALDAINEVLASSGCDREVVQTKSGYQLRLHRHFSDPGQLLGPLAESAADLLSSGDLSLVKKCQNPQCILYFCDTTKNHRRRWCSMAACGNRAKVAAHYQRARQRHSGDDRK